jgi:hypothetical protein
LFAAGGNGGREAVVAGAATAGAVTETAAVFAPGAPGGVEPGALVATAPVVDAA